MARTTTATKLDDEEFYFIANGLCCCSVCVPKGMSREVIEQIANTRNPTGIGSKWTISTDAHFSGGQTNPCACDSDPNRMHYLLDC